MAAHPLTAMPAEDMVQKQHAIIEGIGVDEGECVPIDQPLRGMVWVLGWVEVESKGGTKVAQGRTPDTSR